jgi:hypothetical protein
MPMQNPQEARQGRGGPAFLLLVARAMACSLEVFLHKSSTFGERYLGPRPGLLL